MHCANRDHIYSVTTANKLEAGAGRGTRETSQAAGQGATREGLQPDGLAAAVPDAPRPCRCALVRPASCACFLLTEVLSKDVEVYLTSRGFALDCERVTKAQSAWTGLKGAALRRDITLREVAQHNTPEDAWLALRGKVPCDTMCESVLRLHCSSSEVTALVTLHHALI